MAMHVNPDKLSILKAADALPGRDQPIPVSTAHFVNGHPIKPPFPQHLQHILLGMGCFWGAEKIFWLLEGVYTTAVGYAAGYTPNPSYQEVCSGLTGHNEVVLVVYDPAIISDTKLLQVFWENHNPTQGMRQGNDVGTQYRSGIYYYHQQQLKLAMRLLDDYQAQLSANNIGEITTEILSATEFYYAEDYHQQYLAKNPQGYCGLGGLNISLIDKNQ